MQPTPRIAHRTVAGLDREASAFATAWAMAKAFIMAAFIVLGASCVAAGESIQEIRKLSRSKRYVAPTSCELDFAEKAFTLLMSGGVDLETVRSVACEAGLEVSTVSSGDEQLFVVRESRRPQKNSSMGWGVFAFRGTRDSRIALQAPHSYADLHTGELAERWFLEQPIAAAAWNTTSRRTKTEVEATEVEATEACPSAAENGATADLAHLPGTLFHSFAAAFARVHPDGILVQVHGFDREARSTAQGRASDIIVSNGVRVPATWIWEVDSALERALLRRVSVYPDEVKELGALKNVQSRLLQESGHRGFLHIEMSLPVRRALTEQEALRGKFWRCIPRKQP